MGYDVSIQLKIYVRAQKLEQVAPCLLLLTLSKVLQVSTDSDTVHLTAWLTLLLNWRACSPIETFPPLKHHCNNVTLRVQCYLHPWVTHWLMNINFSLLCFTYCWFSWTWALRTRELEAVSWPTHSHRNTFPSHSCRVENWVQNMPSTPGT